ncbi:lamin tail domain-containing protein [Streptomyces sp. NPDC015171]|uniref:lamin tail domain-containing protein n=1 Tax=Streptomyces sp. NPDC015171 TaxID=3364945 RepID=UPI0036FFCE82
MSASVLVSVRRAAAVAVAAAAVVGSVALPASAVDHDHGRAHRPAVGHDHGRAHRPDVVIGDVQHQAPVRHGGYRAALNKEWVEVSNEGGRAVNLDGWTLADEGGHVYTFRNYRLGAGQTVRVHTGVGRDRKNDLYQDLRRSVWDTGHDTAILRNGHGRYIDSVSWGYERRDHRGHRDGGRYGRHH